jgi:hypothetical protein
MAFVEHEQLVQIAAMLPSDRETAHAADRRSTGDRFDVPAFLARHGIAVLYDAPWSSGHKWVLECCVWNPEHTDRSAVVVQFADGRLGAKCQHYSCAGRGWRELRAALEPDYASRSAVPREADPARVDRTDATANEEKPKPPPPRLDIGAALPSWLADDCRAIAAWVQIAVEVVVTCVLSHVCAAIGNTRWIRARGIELPLSLHFITSLLSGSGKSEVRKYLRKCAAQIEREISKRREEAKEAAEEYADALAAWRSDKRGSPKRRADAGERPQPPPPDPRGGPRTTYVLSEGTLDGVIATVGDTPRGVLWATDEAPEIVGMLGAYGDSEGRRALDAARLRKLTEGQPVEAHRAKSNADPIRRVHRPFLGLDSDVQPGVLAGLFNDEDHYSGTLARLFIHEPPSLLGQRDYITPPPVPGPDVRQRLENLLLGLWRLPLALDEDGFGVPEPEYLELSPEAERLWAEEMQKLEREYAGATATMVGILGHLRGRLLRLAGNLALIRDAKVERVEERDMARAIVLGRYFRAHAERLWGAGQAAETPEERAARELVAWFAANAGATARDAVGGLQRFRGPGGAERAVAALNALSGPDGPLRREQGPRAVRYFARGATAGASASGTGQGGPKNATTAGAGTPGAPDARESEEPRGTAKDPHADAEREAIRAEANDAEDAELERLLEEAEDAKKKGDLDGEDVGSW